MNTNPNAKRILCYGDSNTWGAIPLEQGKYPAHVRWTGVLQNRLGEDYEVIEEGLRSRTTNIDDPKRIDRNGKTYFHPCLETHTPLDLCIIWLGTNDLKQRFKRTAEDVAKAAQELIQMAKEETEGRTKILLVCPPVIYDTETTKEYDFVDPYSTSLALGAQYNKIADEEKVHFINLAKEGVTPDETEGVHLTKEMHQKIGELFAKKVIEII